MGVVLVFFLHRLSFLLLLLLLLLRLARVFCFECFLSLFPFYFWLAAAGVSAGRLFL